MFYPQLQATIDARLEEFGEIPEERKAVLEPLISFITLRLQKDQPVHLNFICTHNSRRSHLSQIWAAIAATHYGMALVRTFSGGTEATAFNPRAVAALRRDGFRIEDPGGDNPLYLVSFGPKSSALTCFSKTYDDPFNESNDFAAVMTCDHADRNCPAVIGASRISVPYRDPKEADNTPEEETRYTERSAQIARELLYALSQATPA